MVLNSVFPLVDSLTCLRSPFQIVLLPTGRIFKYHLFATLKQNILSRNVRYLHCVSDSSVELKVELSMAGNTVDRNTVTQTKAWVCLLSTLF